MRKGLFTLFVILLAFCSPSFATQQDDAPLPVDQAFQFSVQVTDSDTLAAHWQIAPGYYLYKSHFNFELTNPQKAKLGQSSFPPAQEINKPSLTGYKVYADSVDISLPLADPAPNQVTLLITYQGCSESGFCYPPVTKQVDANLQSGLVAISTPTEVPVSIDTDNSNRFSQLLTQSHLGWLLLSFFGFGLLLAFTPCILPMLPILMGIIAGQKNNLSTRKAFLLSLTYVLSVAVTFAIAGVIASLLGYSLQAAFQNPWVIISFSLLFIALALSLFGLYELQLPYALRNRLNSISERQQGGTYLGVAAMGFLSTLIASPCVSAPLVGALSYISTTGNAGVGGLALFALGLGMGMPLLIIGTSGGKLLPKAGRWMKTIKIILGVLLLGLAILFLSRLLPSSSADSTFQRVTTTAQVEQLLNQAKSEGKPAVLDFYADWCLECKVIEKTVFQNPGVSSYLHTVVFIQADVTANDKDSKALNKQYNVFAPPTVLFFNGQGQEQHRIVGSMSLDDFLKQLNVSKNPASSQ